MAFELTLTFADIGDLAHFLHQYHQQGAVLIPLAELPPDLVQYAPVKINVVYGDEQHQIAAETLQLMPPAGLVVRLDQTADLDALVANCPPPAQPGPPPMIALGPPPKKGKVGAVKLPPGMGPLSWPIEKLQAEYAGLSTADKVRLAKYGKRPARSLALRSQDRQLHNFLLMNTKIGADEVAILAGMANADNALLQRIAKSNEWVRHTNIVRNLVCNPKMTIPQVTKLLNHMPTDELRRLSRTGRVRAAIKRLIIKRLEVAR